MVGYRVEAMKVKYQDNLKYKILNRISNLRGNVVLRSDLSDLGGYRSISYALKSLVTEEKLARISFGVYAKTFESEYTGKYILQGGFNAAAINALDRLGIKWDLTRAQKAYNEGKTTQVPVKPSIRLRSRCRRVFALGKSKLVYEEGIYAK